MLTVTFDGVAYRATPDGEITPETPVSRVVADMMETGEPIGPQVDEYAGLVGDWALYPEAVIAAFLDVAASKGTRLGPVSYVDDAAVTAAIGEGGFDQLGTRPGRCPAARWKNLYHDRAVLLG